MLWRTILAVAVIMALPLAGMTAMGQDYGAVNGGVYSSSPNENIKSGFYHQNCGRPVTTAEAASLWAGYCTDDCSFNGSGCHRGCGLFRCCRRGRGCGRSCGGGCLSGRHRGCGKRAADCGSCGVDCGDMTVADQGLNGGCGYDGGCGCKLFSRCKCGGGCFARLFRKCGSGGGCYQSCVPEATAVAAPVDCGCEMSGSRCGHGCCLFGRKARRGSADCCCGSTARRCGHRKCGGCKRRKANCGCYQMACGCDESASGIGGGCGCEVSGMSGCGCRAGRKGCRKGCCLLNRCRRAGRSGYDGGYFYDAPVNCGNQMGLISAGCATESVPAETDIDINETPPSDPGVAPQDDGQPDSVSFQLNGGGL